MVEIQGWFTIDDWNSDFRPVLDDKIKSASLEDINLVVLESNTLCTVVVSGVPNHDRGYIASFINLSEEISVHSDIHGVLMYKDLFIDDPFEIVYLGRDIRLPGAY